MEGFKQRIASLKEALANSAGVDPSEDRFRVGAINAYSDILNISVEELDD